jgi:hypothetical protein
VTLYDFAHFAGRDTADEGQWITDHFREIDGLAVTIKMKDGSHRTVFTGCYKRHPQEAAGVALRLSMRLANAADQTMS